MTFDGGRDRRSWRLSMVAALALMVGGAFALSTVPAAADPPGNNGTVKVDGVAFDDHPDNEPHVGCEFQIDFYGYDQGDLDAQVIFTGIAPTGGGVLATDSVFIGEDPAGGGTDLDASATYDLTAALAGIQPHPVQGHHVWLTVHAEGSRGADVKHKAFWVTGCDSPHPPTTVPRPPPPPPAPSSTTTVPTTTTPSVEETTSTTARVTTTTSAGATTTTGPETTTTAPGATVLESTTSILGATPPGGDTPGGEVGALPATPEEGLAFTGGGTRWLLLGIAMIVTGALTMVVQRRRAH